MEKIVIVADYKIRGIRINQPSIDNPLCPEHIQEKLDAGKKVKRASNVYDFKEKIRERAEKEYQKSFITLDEAGTPIPEDLPRAMPIKFLETVIEKTNEETANLDIFFEVERIPQFNEIIPSTLAHEAVLRAINRVCRNYQQGILINRISYREVHPREMRKSKQLKDMQA